MALVFQWRLFSRVLLQLTVGNGVCYLSYLGVWHIFGKVWHLNEGQDAAGIPYLSSQGLFFDFWLKFVFVANLFTVLRDLGWLFVDSTNVKKRSALEFPHVYLGDIYTFLIQPESDVMFPAFSNQGPRGNGLRPDIIRAVFGQGMTMRKGKVMLKLVKTLTVAAGMIVNATRLPPRNPITPLNQARHYIVFLELSVLFVIWVYMIRTVYNMTKSHLYRSSQMCNLLIQQRRASEWSALLFLRYADVATTATQAMQQMRVTEEFGNPRAKYYTAGCVFGYRLLLSGLGILGLVLKATQVTQFASTTLWWDYSWGDVVAVIAFGMNATSVYNIAEERKDAIKKFGVREYEQVLTFFPVEPPIWLAWQKFFGAAVLREFGFIDCLCIVFTLDEADLRKVFIDQGGDTMTDLMTMIFTTDRPMGNELFHLEAEICKSHYRERLTDSRRVVRAYLEDMQNRQPLLVSP